MKKHWFKNIETGEERLLTLEDAKRELDDKWVRGRVIDNKGKIGCKYKFKDKEHYIQAQRRNQTNKIGYTNGEINIWLRCGQDIPEGFYRGWTITEPWKYWSNIKKEKTLWQLKQQMEEQK